MDIFGNKIFCESKILLELVKELKNNDYNFDVSEEKMFTFDSEGLGDINTYEIFLKRFEYMSNNELKFTDIHVDDLTNNIKEQDLEELILQDIGINGRIKMKKFNPGFVKRPMRVDFKINGNSTSIEAEFMYGWFDYRFFSSLNQKLRELNYSKYFWFSNCWEECTVVYATQDDISKINCEIEGNIEFRGYNSFDLK